MYRQSFSTASGPADFPGALVQLTRPKQVFVEHVVFANHAPVHRRMLPEIISVLNSFISFTRSSIATRVTEADLIENVPADQARMDYDPITLAQKGLLIEEARTNALIQSSNLLSATWPLNGTSIATSTNFPFLLPPGHLF